MDLEARSIRIREVREILWLLARPALTSSFNLRSDFKMSF
jgi:hypothetical protein